MKEILIDTREFEAPAPMQMALSALQSVIKNESYLHQIHRLVPQMLLNKIKGLEYDYIVKEDRENYHIYIFYKDDKEKVKEIIS
ncbi:MAG TPA: hypothetical protein EYP79_01495 [Campylobacterales bacterium]|nr:hypothetical protein [Campylobacterales bacterium]